MIIVTCKHCGTDAEAPNDMAGQTVACPNCAEPMRLPVPGKAQKPKKQIRTASSRKPAPPAPPPPSQAEYEIPAARKPSYQGQPEGVVIRDIKMPFGSMVVFIIKWTFASIPALLIMSLIWFLIMLLIGAALGGIGAAFSNLGR